jgi:hypothetical protein
MPIPAPRDEPLATVALADTPAEGERLRDALSAAGIAAVLEPEVEGGSPLDGLAVRARASAAARALALLRAGAEPGGSDPDEGDADGAGTAVCLSCGASFPGYLERCPACGLGYS